MEIKKVTPVGKKPVYDLSVQGCEHYVLENGIVTHNTGPMYSANTVIIVGRQQEKEGKDLVGYNFILNIEKSRTVKEKSKIPLSVTFDGGINTFSGLLDMAVDIGFVNKPSNGWFSRATSFDADTGEIKYEDKKSRRKDTDITDWWKPLFQMPEFKDAVKSKYKLGEVQIKNLDESEDSLYDEIDYTE